MALDPRKAKEGKEIVDSMALHPDFQAGLAKVAEVSIEKGYEIFNWLRKESPTRVSTFLKAHARHLREFKRGIDVNIEKRQDGSTIDIQVNHLVYAAYNLLMAAQLVQDLPEHDDRIKLSRNVEVRRGDLNAKLDLMNGATISAQGTYGTPQGKTINVTTYSPKAYGSVETVPGGCYMDLDGNLRNDLERQTRGDKDA